MFPLTLLTALTAAGLAASGSAASVVERQAAGPTSVYKLHAVTVAGGIDLANYPAGLVLEVEER